MGGSSLLFENISHLFFQIIYLISFDNPSLAFWGIVDDWVVKVLIAIVVIPCVIVGLLLLFILALIIRAIVKKRKSVKQKKQLNYNQN
jgi:hypothetical protein